MPQSSVAYAVARVHYQMRDTLSWAHLERMLSAPSYEDALRALSEIGWGNTSGADVEATVAAHVTEACALVKAVTPCQDATDCFLLRYDGLNIKSLMKARCLSTKTDSLSECGIYAPDLLRHAVAERNYTTLPALNPALTKLEKSLAMKADPLLIETAVDKALFELIARKLQNVESPAVKRYFSGRADIGNAIMLLRVKHMGKNAAFMREMLLPGGSITPDQWGEAYEKPELLYKYLSRYGEKVITAATLSTQSEKALPTLEKAMDDTLLKPFTALRYNPLRIEPVVGYLLGAIRESAAVRLILSGKKNGFAQAAIEERLRDLYGD